MGKVPWQGDERRAFNIRCRDEGRWDAFVEIRELWRARGVLDKVAWQVAGIQFPPLNGDPLEFEPEQAALDLYDFWGTQNTPNPSLIVQEKKNFHRFPKGGTEQTQDELMPPEKRWKTAEEFVKKVPSDRESNALEEMRWAFSRYMTPWSEIDPEECPSHGAVGLLRHIKLSQTNYSELLKVAWAKTIPDRKAIEAANRMLDDGRTILADLDAFDAEFESGVVEAVA